MTEEMAEHVGSLPTPIGHDAAEQVFDRAFAAGRVAHAWLLTGPQGIGKSTLALRIAARILAGGDRNDSGAALFGDLPVSDGLPAAAAQVLSGSHPDLMTVARQTSDETGKVQKEIGVDAVRRLGHFLRLTPAAGGWRVVIIDSADDLNRNAANALLKLLEEPPKNVLLLLISHSPHRLLPTIRSRCRQLPLSPLSEVQTRAVLSRIAPEASADDLDLAARLADGCPGRGLALLEADRLSVFRSVLGQLENLPRIDAKSIDALGDAVARAKEEGPLRQVFETLEWWAHRRIRSMATGHAEDGARVTASRRDAPRELEHWLEVWDKISRLRHGTESANLDRKQAVLSAFTLLEAAVRP
jgi:DNA polymerase-3 subunit delta'